MILNLKLIIKRNCKSTFTSPNRTVCDDFVALQTFDLLIQATKSSHTAVTLCASFSEKMYNI